MKTILLLSKDKQVVELISAAVAATGFGGTVQVVRTDMLLLLRISDLDHAPPAAVFIDLTASADAIRLVEWLKFSLHTRRLRSVAIGEEGVALSIFRNAWGAPAVLTKPLQTAAVEEAVARLNLATTPTEENLRAELRKKLAESVAKSKESGGRQEKLLQCVDPLLAELKGRKMPFKRSWKGPEPPELREQSA